MRFLHAAIRIESNWTAPIVPIVAHTCICQLKIENEEYQSAYSAKYYFILTPCKKKESVEGVSIQFKSTKYRTDFEKNHYACGLKKVLTHLEEGAFRLAEPSGLNALAVPHFRHTTSSMFPISGFFFRNGRRPGDCFKFCGARSSEYTCKVPIHWHYCLFTMMILSAQWCICVILLTLAPQR